ncbi:LacI family DNA-binding transcriptional regulator [Brevundimonas sp.]|uniref:LacI family DNA-binding transcriptional regulator n=1 Tax=Brevundimonas sp. TaxID=1871086 RepID=UPI0025F09673|nr:LacI family DNA-binding transcriptional regulator [Brevundimonas sp.]
MGVATINDVARLAGVSIKTVSRVMNREPNVREETRAKVLSVAESLQYRPSQSARSLAGSRSFLIGLLFDNPSAAYVTDVQLGAAARCRASGRHLVIEPVDTAAPDLPKLVRETCRALRLDGVILTPPVCDDARVLDVLEQMGVPYVRLAPNRDPDRSPRVTMDDRAAAAEMTRKLIALGHTDIGFVIGHPDHGASELRRQGFVDAMREAGLETRPDRMIQGRFSFRSGFDAGEALLGQGRPTAVFASNDDMALGVMAAARQLGLDVPRDLSIAGFDDTPAAQSVWPPLTTVAQPIGAMAAAAADMIIDGEAAHPHTGAPPSRELGFTLRMRGSTVEPA